MVRIITRKYISKARMSVVIIISLLSAVSVHGEKILMVNPVPSKSHQVVFRPLTQELAKRGHDVMVITTDPCVPAGRTPGNLTVISDQDTSHRLLNLTKNIKSTEVEHNFQVNLLLKDFANIFEAQLNMEQVKNLLEDTSQKFDLIVIDSFVRATSLGLSHLYNAPVISVSTLGTLPMYNKVTGIPEHYLLTPQWLRPLPPNVVGINEMHLNPEKPLPKHLKQYLDSSKHGVIYVSFGNNVLPSLWPRRKIDVFLNVFSHLPYDVLWMWDQDMLPGKLDRIKIAKWFPQADLLRHPNIQLFITQGGLQSIVEAVSAGVPMIGIPMLADQRMNTEQYAYNGIGLKLHRDTLSEQLLTDAISAVAGNYSYRKSVDKFRSLIFDHPESSLERAVWWVERTLHGGARHLRASGADVTWYDYLELQLVALSLLVCIITLFITVSILQYAQACLKGISHF